MRHNVAPAAVVLLVMSVVPALVVRGQSTPQTVRVSGLVGGELLLSPVIR